MIEDVKTAWKAIKNKTPGYSEYWDYYDGDHPIEFSTTRLREIFRGMDVKFHENWCRVVIDAVTDRLALAGAEVRKKRAQRAFDQLWADLQLGLDADDVHEAALVSGEGCLVVWEGDGLPDVYVNDSRLVHVQYDAERPKVKRWAAKFWMDASRWYCVVYYPDRLEYYQSTNEQASAWREWKRPALNQWGVIPVFHFRPESRVLHSDLADVVPIQRAVNKMVSDLVVTSEFTAFPQRVVVSNADLSALKIRPHELWEIPAGTRDDEQTQFGSFPNADLQGFIAALDHFIAAISAVTRTPTHHFFRSGSQVSGEALELLEAPLVRKVEKRAERFSSEWSQAFSFLLRLRGVNVPPDDIRPIWKPAGSLPEISKAKIRETNARAGVPIITQLRNEGWSDAAIERLVADGRMASEEWRVANSE